LAAPSGAFPDLKLLSLFATGAFIMRSAGCTINDMWDRDFDAKVQRTNKRPLATGEISMSQGLVFLGAQLSAGLAILLQLNMSSIYMGLGVMPLVISYPLMKRFTNWPQLVLGLTMNWGALLGFAAAAGGGAMAEASLSVEQMSVVFPLYAGSVSWTLVYDTLYAHQDKEDDKRLGLRSTALYFGDNTKPILMGFGTLAITGIMASGYLVDLAWPFYAGMGISAGHLRWQIQTADLADNTNLWERFQANGTFGFIVASSIVAGKVFS